MHLTVESPPPFQQEIESLLQQIIEIPDTSFKELLAFSDRFDAIIDAYLREHGKNPLQFTDQDAAVITAAIIGTAQQKEIEVDDQALLSTLIQVFNHKLSLLELHTP